MLAIQNYRLGAYYRSAIFVDFLLKKKKKKKELAKAEVLSMAGVNHEQVKVLRGEVYELLVEDYLWHQRSLVDWLKSGDTNTCYFHSQASQHNKRNFISKLILDDGSAVEDSKKIGEAFVDYFNKL